MITNLWAFLGLSILVITAPGPDTIVVTKNAVLHGRRSGLATSLGVNSGLLIWTAGAALGLDALIRASAVAFDTLKVLGAVYLIWLGVNALRSAGRRADLPLVEEGGAGRGGPGAAARGFRQGLLTNLANPKIAVFFTSLLPQFVAGRSSALPALALLGTLFVTINLVWMSAYALVASRISAVLTRRRVRAVLGRVTGAVLIGFGIRVALESR